MVKQINIELPDFCEGCNLFSLESEKVQGINLDGSVTTMEYHTCEHKDFCVYQYSRMTSNKVI